ncbi:MAG: hypothetical protein ACXVB0_08560 [Mucilaginibacter sp.]
MKKLLPFLAAAILLTGCLKFGHHPIISPDTLNMANIKGRWSFYSDTVIVSSGGLSSVATNDFKDKTDYYIRFNGDGTGTEWLGDQAANHFNFTYTLSYNQLTIDYINDPTNADFNLPTIMVADVLAFRRNKMIFRNYHTFSAGVSSSVTTLSLTR